METKRRRVDGDTSSTGNGVCKHRALSRRDILDLGPFSCRLYIVILARCWKFRRVGVSSCIILRALNLIHPVLKLSITFYVVVYIVILAAGSFIRSPLCQLL